ncbi:MAG: replicative DNA helicase [Clostridia bacterium]|nr:replicative DNA helicase [Clostridia bacterium]MBQ5612841.1 replicative DNA helicase [Clostridia bacterium]MBQ5773044.1 replicative DNA helicase [Clostridia bacterium]
MQDEMMKKLPFSMPAEQSLLGSILIDPVSLSEVADALTAEDFYLTEHKQIYLAMHELFLTNKEIDVVTLIDMLVVKGIYDKSGGEDYIRTLTETVPDALNVKDYARIVKEKSVLRQLIAACGEISESAYSEQESVSSVLDHAQNLIFQIAQGRDTKNFRHIREVLGDVYGHLHELNTNREATRGTQTGFSALDRVLAGLGKSDLVLVGARPGMGKTSFALNIATNVAKQTKKKVCIFSLEMSAEQLVNRVLSSEALVNSYALRTGELSPEDWEHLAVAAGELAGCDILIDDSSGQTVTAMKAKLRRVQGLGMVIIDYLGLMQGDHHTDNRVQEISEITRSLKILAKELMVPVVCCAQLSRGPESRTDKKPMLSDLRDSGSIEQDADTVIFLYRSEYYKTGEANQDTSVAEVIIAKNRHGSTGTVNMGWNGQFTKFITIDNDQEVH